MGLRRMVLLDRKVYLGVPTGFAVVIGTALYRVIARLFDAFVPVPGVFTPAGCEPRPQALGLSWQGFPRSVGTPPSVHVRFAPAEASGPKNRASSWMRFAGDYHLTPNRSSLRFKHEILSVLTVRPRLAPRLQAPWRRQFLPVFLGSPLTAGLKKAGSDLLAKSCLIFQARHRRAAEKRGRIPSLPEREQRCVPPRRGRRPRSNGRTPRKPEAVEVTSPRLYVGNLSFDATETDLSELFNGVGQVVTVEVVSPQANPAFKGVRVRADADDRRGQARRARSCTTRNSWAANWW